MTTKEMISEWFDAGVEIKASHMIVVCDTFDYEDYPVYVEKTEDVPAKVLECSKNMQRVMETYDLRADKKNQLNSSRNNRI